MLSSSNTTEITLALFASDFTALVYAILIIWGIVSAAFGFGCAGIIVAYSKRKRYWWMGIPFTVVWAFVFSLVFHWLD